MLALRLDNLLEHQISHACAALQIGKSELVRRSLQNYLSQHAKPSPWEAGQALFGAFDSGQPQLASQRKQLLRQRLRAKHQA